MSTYRKLRELQDKYQEELNERLEVGESDNTIDLLQRVIKDISDVATDASWQEFPEDMGR